MIIILSSFVSMVGTSPTETMDIEKTIQKPTEKPTVKVTQKPTKKVPTIVKKTRKSPKYFPCEQYEKDGEAHVPWQKNDTLFCRKTTKKRRTAKSGYEYCKSQPMKKLQEWAVIFHIRTDPEHIPEQICSRLEMWKHEPEPSIQVLKYVASKIRVKIRDAKNDKRVIKMRIRQKIYEHMSATFRNILGKDIENVPVNYIVTLIYKALIPDGFKQHTQLDISEEFYKELIALEKDKQLDGYKRGILNKSMERKLDHCFKKLSFLNTFLKKLVNDIDGYVENPYAVCKQSIFVNRNINFSSD